MSFCVSGKCLAKSHLGLIKLSLQNSFENIKLFDTESISIGHCYAVSDLKKCKRRKNGSWILKATEKTKIEEIHEIVEYEELGLVNYCGTVTSLNCNLNSLTLDGEVLVFLQFKLLDVNLIGRQVTIYNAHFVDRNLLPVDIRGECSTFLRCCALSYLNGLSNILLPLSFFDRLNCFIIGQQGRELFHSFPFTKSVDIFDLLYSLYKSDGFIDAFCDHFNCDESLEGKNFDKVSPFPSAEGSICIGVIGATSDSKLPVFWNQHGIIQLVGAIDPSHFNSLCLITKYEVIEEPIDGPVLSCPIQQVIFPTFTQNPCKCWNYLKVNANNIFILARLKKSPSAKDSFQFKLKFIDRNFLQVEKNGTNCILQLSDSMSGIKSFLAVNSMYEVEGAKKIGSNVIEIYDLNAEVSIRMLQKDVKDDALSVSEFLRIKVSNESLLYSIYGILVGKEKRDKQILYKLKDSQDSSVIIDIYGDEWFIPTESIPVVIRFVQRKISSRLNVYAHCANSNFEFGEHKRDADTLHERVVDVLDDKSIVFGTFKLTIMRRIDSQDKPMYWGFDSTADCIIITDSTDLKDFSIGSEWIIEGTVRRMNEINIKTFSIGGNVGRTFGYGSCLLKVKRMDRADSISEIQRLLKSFVL